ncbi:MAG: glycosyltransferase [Bacteroidetes bacterium]|nr:glycosyltransferase [Bacteroidota bacterium]
MHEIQRIAFCCTTRSLGGMELNIIRLAVWMRERGHHCVVVAAEDAPIRERALTAGLPCMTLDIRSRYIVRGAAHRLARQLGEERISTLVLNTSRDLLLGVLTKRRSDVGLRLLHTQHMQIGQRKKDVLHRWQYRHLDAWIAPLPSMAEQTLRLTNISPERIHIIPFGIDLRQYAASITRDTARSTLQLPPEAYIVGMVGRLDRGKGQEFLLRAVAQLHNQGLNIHALLIGEETRGETQGYAEELHALARELNIETYIHFRGFRENVSTAYAAMNAFTLTSLSETYGMVTIEAMAAGLPVVATDSGGTPDLVTDEMTALLIPPADEVALAAAIRRLAEDGELAQRLARNAHACAQLHFSHSMQCEKVEQLIERITL